MASSELKRVGRDLLVWMVAFVAAAEALAQAIQGILDHRVDHFVLYLLTTLAVIFLAVSIERVKHFIDTL